ncbi:MAG: hypothetical protein TR69_WS6001000480 [candidate division WS6 bacterium OLB20]|uniref:Amidinotransferase n=1 Tax=candidate division WS6 bacterium OLB20 TaxID=1617426 RepID=A0A136LXX1_9BACT|nr:MAG: hypothetical protein TR69_WS6001000480 [candidate division WS6 bacterium OLB20]
MRYILVCAPDFFSIDYEINPWMHVENAVDGSSAAEQFADLLATYSKLGIEVKQIDQVRGLPDMVYTANFGFAIDDLFILRGLSMTSANPRQIMLQSGLQHRGLELSTCLRGSSTKVKAIT